VSQLLTLFITPVVYYYLDKVDSYLSGRARHPVVLSPTPQLKPAE
jgi:HAE1 family hydrophobic/amphiphilic exporter-1